MDEQKLTEQPNDAASETERNLNEAANVRYLGRDDFVLIRTEGGSLRITLPEDKSYLRIKCRRCFPFAFPTQYISVRDAADEEIGIIRNLADLPADWRAWILDDIEMRYYTPRVKSIKNIRRRWGGYEWYVLTDRGSKKIITKGVHDTMSEVQPGRYIITDVDGNRFELHSAKLDEVSKEKVEQLV